MVVVTNVSRKKSWKWALRPKPEKKMLKQGRFLKIHSAFCKTYQTLRKFLNAFDVRKTVFLSKKRFKMKMTKLDLRFWDNCFSLQSLWVPNFKQNKSTKILIQALFTESRNKRLKSKKKIFQLRVKKEKKRNPKVIVRYWLCWSVQSVYHFIP